MPQQDFNPHSEQLARQMSEEPSPVNPALTAGMTEEQKARLKERFLELQNQTPAPMAGDPLAEEMAGPAVQVTHWDEPPLKDRLAELTTEVKKHQQTLQAEDFQMKARRLVAEHFNNLVDVTDGYQLPISDVYVVWFCKTLQNWKACLSTNIPDGMYYEVTYNGEKRETYIDAYKKVANARIPDQPE